MQNAAWIGKSGPRSEYHVVTSLTHRLSGAARCFWEQRPADGIVIGRDVPSRAIARLLSQIVVYRPIDGGRDFVVHIAGDSVRRRFSADITGKKLTELFPPEECPIRSGTLVEAMERNEPRMVTIGHSNGSLEILRLELLILPALSPDRSEMWPLIFCFYF